MSPRPRWPQRLLPVLVALTCVVLAAVGLRLSEPPAHEFLRGELGARVTLNDGDVTVDQLQVGDSLLENGDITYRTPGMFVVVNVSAAATGSRPLRLTDSRLTSGDRSYLPFSNPSSMTADPGFVANADLVYEVDPTRIDGLTIELWQDEIVGGYYQRVQIPLQITAGNAEQWRSRAHVPVVEPNVNGTSKAIP
jgi:hypothetical protein